LDGAGQPVRYPSYITEYDGQLYFRGTPADGSSNAELWRSDGNTAELVADIYPGINGSSPTALAVYNNKLYFGATANTGAAKLWEYDSVTNIASLAPGSSTNATISDEMIAYGGNLFFRATRYGAPSNIGTELWKFDGTNQTPIDMYPGSGSSYPQHFIVNNGLLYFNACGTPGQGTELWCYDGVTPYYEAARIYPNNGSSPENFAVLNNTLYFSAYDGVHGRELWAFDGAASLAADIVPGGQYSSSNPNQLAAFNGKLFFSATDGIHGYELWSFDGTTAQMVSEINPTANPGNGDDWLMDSSPADLTVFNGLLYFSANDGVHGRELWASNGETAWMIEDINPGQYGSDVSELTVFNGQLYFAADQLYAPGVGSFSPTVWAIAVPEPGSFALLLAGGALLALRRRRASCSKTLFDGK
jgi:ELWxxDGT repeat protein